MWRILVFILSVSRRVLRLCVILVNVDPQFRSITALHINYNPPKTLSAAQPSQLPLAHVNIPVSSSIERNDELVFTTKTESTYINSDADDNTHENEEVYDVMGQGE